MLSRGNDALPLRIPSNDPGEQLREKKPDCTPPAPLHLGFYEEIRLEQLIPVWRPFLGATLSAARPGWATPGNWDPASIRANP